MTAVDTTGMGAQPGPLAELSVVRPLDISVVMPCLNEAETLASCIAKAKTGLEKTGVSGEILIAVTFNLGY